MPEYQTPHRPMCESHRLAYLQALGIPIWIHRETASPIAIKNAVDEVQTETFSTHENTSHPQTIVENLTESLRFSPKTAVKPATQTIDAEKPEQTLPDCSGLVWETLNQKIVSCQSCQLHISRNQAIPGKGDTSAKCMVIGDSPSYEDDKSGLPFAGKSGQLLTRMLLAIDLPRHTVFLSNATKCRASNDRAPSGNELSHCYPYLYREIELVNPDKILILGRITAQHLLKQKASLAKLRGQVHTLPNTDITVVVTYHPRNLLKQPKDKHKAWVDLKLFRKTSS